MRNRQRHIRPPVSSGIGRSCCVFRDYKNVIIVKLGLIGDVRRKLLIQSCRSVLHIGRFLIRN